MDNRSNKVVDWQIDWSQSSIRNDQAHDQDCDRVPFGIGNDPNLINLFVVKFTQLKVDTYLT